MDRRGFAGSLGSILLMLAVVLILLFGFNAFFKKAENQTTDVLQNTCVAVGRCEFVRDIPADFVAQGATPGCKDGYEEALEYKCPMINKDGSQFPRLCCVKTANFRESHVGTPAVREAVVEQTLSNTPCETNYKSLNAMCLTVESARVSCTGDKEIVAGERANCVNEYPVCCIRKIS